MAAFGFAVGLSTLCSPASAAADDSASVLLTPIPDGIYSGYAALAPAFTTVTGHWKQPAVTCGPAYAGLTGGVANMVNTGSSMLKVPGLTGLGLASTLLTSHVGPWIGMEGMNGKDRVLVQTGTSVNCVLGVPRNIAFFDVPSTQNQEPALTWDAPPTLPGDDMQATITWDGHDTYRMTLRNITRGWRKDQTNHIAVVPRAALAVVESIPYEVPSFSSVSFTDVTANGKPLGAYGPTALHITSPLSPPTPLQGSAFTVPAFAG